MTFLSFTHKVISHWLENKKDDQCECDYDLIGNECFSVSLQSEIRNISLNCEISEEAYSTLPRYKF